MNYKQHIMVFLFSFVFQSIYSCQRNEVSKINTALQRRDMLKLESFKVPTRQINNSETKVCITMPGSNPIVVAIFSITDVQ